MITVEFAKGYRAMDVESFSFNTYKEFFEFYMTHKNKGLIFNEKDDGLTR